MALAVPAEALELRPKATLQLDHGHFAGSQTLPGNRFLLRRAKIGADGAFSSALTFQLDYEMARHGTLKPVAGHFKSVSLTWKAPELGSFTIGQMKTPFGLTKLASSSHDPSLERALPVEAFVLSHRLGAAFSRTRPHYSFSGMVFGGSINNGSRGHGAAARMTVAPVHNAADVVHLGIAAIAERPDGRTHFSTPPEADIARVKFVDTGPIAGVRHTRRLALEGAVRHGPLLLQGEWLEVKVARDTLPDLHFSGWYAEGSLLLSGESRPYSNRFGSVTPKSRKGALELAARYSEIDLESHDVEGGRERNMAFGLNYYLNRDTRLMLHYVASDSQRESPEMLLLRLQLAY